MIKKTTAKKAKKVKVPPKPFPVESTAPVDVPPEKEDKGYRMTAKPRGKSQRGALVHQFSKPGIYLSVPQFSGEAGIDRQILIRKLNNASGLVVEQSPHGMCYRLRDLITIGLLSDQQGQLDPEKLDPYRRKAYYASQLDRTRLMKETGDLVKLIDMEARCAAAAKIAAQFFDTLPDILERDTGATPQQLVKLEEVLDGVREEIYRAMLHMADEADKEIETTTPQPIIVPETEEVTA